MRSRTLSATAMILLMPLAALALQAQTDQVRSRELKNRSFTTGALKMTLTRFYADGVPTVGNIDIEVENMSGDFTTFAPQMLAFIDKDNNQVNIVGQYAGWEGNDGWKVVAAGDKRICPNAKIKHSYKLTNKVQLPARLYYEDKLLATIIE
jgi:hypothetical protein